jgi:phosphoribosyl 1,2-cyclic phosphodiesterase
MRFASIGSGSRGNGTLIHDGDTCLLVDLGFTIKETEKRLSGLGMNPESISAIIVTHEHSDHLNGVGPFARKYNLPVYMTPGTHDQRKLGKIPQLKLISCHQSFRIESFNVEPVPVPHDAREPCQYLISKQTKTLGVLTDLGHITPFVVERFSSCDGLILECNHDPQMLADGPYPYLLKVRVGGDHGHLSNQQAAGLLERMDLARLRHLIIAHVSEKNNSLDLLRSEVLGILSDWQGQLTIADQKQGFDWIDLD